MVSASSLALEPVDDSCGGESGVNPATTFLVVGRRYRCGCRVNPGSNDDTDGKSRNEPGSFRCDEDDGH